MAKLWNDNDYPFTQEFKGEKYSIPPKSFIEMEYSEAVAFKSYPSPIVRDGMGQDKPQFMKKLRVEGGPVQDTVVAYKCHYDGTLHATKEALAEHARQFEDKRIVSIDEQKKTGLKTKKHDELS